MKTKLLKDTWKVQLFWGVLTFLLIGCGGSTNDLESNSPHDEANKLIVNHHSTASTPIAHTFYLSPTGSDTATGTSNDPWRTLEKARDHIRTIATFTGNVVVVLQDGTYELTSPFTLTSADSGKDGFRVIYQADTRATPVISGGKVITGWTDANSDGIWEANVAAGNHSRQLYVNNTRATRARSVNGAGWSRNGTAGLYNAPSGASTWANQQDIELAIHYRWKMYRAPVASISGTLATLESDYWDLAKLGPFGIIDQTTHINWVENAFELLDAEGEWYLNRTTNKLYYKPRSGESMTGSGAVTVVLPQLETLIEGTDVTNVTFNGLTFSHATWLHPNTNQGYVSIQSGAVLKDPNYITIEDAFDGLEAVPGNVRFTHSSYITFSNNTFKHLGGTGLELGRASQNNTIFQNTFEDISASAITIGHLQDHHVASAALETKDNLIDNNKIDSPSREYLDASGIFVFYASGTVIINNDVINTPYTAISIGYGWGRYDVDQFAFTSDNTGKAYNTATQQKDTLVLYNWIEKPMQILHDGGGVYNLSANMNSRITGNVITGAIDLNGAVYLDDGSRGFQVNDNVSYNNQGPRVNGHIKGAAYHTLSNNDWSGSSASYNSSFQSIVDAAGRITTAQRTISDIINSLPAALPLPGGSTPPELGLVVGKVAQASVNNSTAGNVIDGNVTTYWDAGSGVRSAWLQVDLNNSTIINGVNLAFGKVGTNNSINYIRNNITFGIQTSTDGANWTNQTFHAGGFGVSNVPDTQSLNTKQAINDLLINSSPTARYVRINVTDSGGQDFGILRLKVKGTALPNGTNLALAGTATQSSTWGGNVASRAIDGVTSGNYAVGQITHTDLGSQPYWTLDLGSVKTIDTIRLWNRTDCCSNRLTNFHVFVSDVAFTGTTVAASQGQTGVLDEHYPNTAGTTVDFTINRTGRYVRVQLANTAVTGDNVLSLAEVEVYGTDSTPSETNLALAGTATQSSTWNGNVASRAIDGVTSGNYPSGQITHTDLGSQPYWTLDLGAVKQINSIKLWNRTDCCSSRLTNFHVFVSDSAFTGTTVAASQGQAGVLDKPFAGTAGTTETFSIDRTGRYVRVQLSSTAVTGENVLSLAEVQVFGTDSGSTPLKVEGESMTVSANTGVATQIQNIPAFGWSDNQQLWWPTTAVGHTLTLSFNVATAGNYALTANLTKAVDYGNLKFLVNGVAVGGADFDGFNNGVVTSLFSLGSHSLNVGTNTLALEVIGKNSSATNYFAGIDYLNLVSQ